MRALSDGSGEHNSERSRLDGFIRGARQGIRQRAMRERFGRGEPPHGSTGGMGKWVICADTRGTPGAVGR